ncbi:MAG: hypothetical protein GY811_19300 [Myxococcales bacterium]|nr:hypothetical protein [Myxococcales bacterium]
MGEFDLHLGDFCAQRGPREAGVHRHDVSAGTVGDVLQYVASGPIHLSDSDEGAAKVVATPSTEAKLAEIEFQGVMRILLVAHG